MSYVALAVDVSDRKGFRQGLRTMKGVHADGRSGTKIAKCPPPFWICLLFCSRQWLWAVVPVLCGYSTTNLAVDRVSCPDLKSLRNTSGILGVTTIISVFILFYHTCKLANTANTVVGLSISLVLSISLSLSLSLFICLPLCL